MANRHRRPLTGFFSKGYPTPSGQNTPLLGGSEATHGSFFTPSGYGLIPRVPSFNQGLLANGPVEIRSSCGWDLAIPSSNHLA